MSFSKICPRVLIIAVFLVIPSSASSQSDFWVKPGTIGDSIVNGIAFKSGDSLYAAVNNGVYRSTDIGAHWTRIGLPDSGVISVAVGTDGQIYAGTAGGPGSFERAFFRSTDDGVHWVKVILDSMFSSGTRVQCIAVDGQGHILAGSFYVYKSTDNGVHWTYSYLEQMVFSYVYAIVPVPSGLIFVANESGVYRSSDGGDSWERKIRGLDDTTAHAIGYDQTGYVYAGIYGMGIYRSDNGEQWDRYDNGVTNHYISSFASNSLDQVFVGTNGGGVFRTTDNGDSWVAVNSGLTNLSVKCLAMSPDGYLYAGTAGGGVFRSQQPTTGIEKLSAAVPRQFSLGQNYPNPFNPSTGIRFTLTSERQVTLKVYDISGREIITLVNEKRSAGEHVVHWNAAGLPSGIYLYRLQAGGFTETKKMVVIR